MLYTHPSSRTIRPGILQCVECVNCTVGDKFDEWLPISFQGVILVYDITSKSSFEAVPKWLNYVRQVNNLKRKFIKTFLFQMIH